MDEKGAGSSTLNRKVKASKRRRGTCAAASSYFYDGGISGFFRWLLRLSQKDTALGRRRRIGFAICDVTSSMIVPVFPCCLTDRIFVVVGGVIYTFKLISSKIWPMRNGDWFSVEV